MKPTSSPVSPPGSRRTLAARFSPLFAQRIRQRGQDYLARHRVALALCTDLEAQATVAGSQPYDVVLRRQGAELEASCTCPHYSGGEMCKHLWAVLLAVDQLGGLRGAADDLPARLVLAGASPRSPEPAEPSWRTLLGALEPAVPEIVELTPPSPLIYVVDTLRTMNERTLVLDLVTVAPAPGGEKPRRFRISRAEIPRLADAADRRILTLLASVAAQTPWNRWSSHGFDELFSPVELPATVAEVLLPLLCATGRCRLRRREDEATGEPLAWEGGEPWDIRLEVRRDEEERDFVVRAVLRRGEERLALGEEDLLLEAGIFCHGGRAQRYASGPLFEWGTALRRLGGELRVPEADREELLGRLLASPGIAGLDLPEDLRVTEVPGSPLPVLRLRPAERWDTYPDWPRGEVAFRYDGREIDPREPRRGVYQPQTRSFLLRDPAAEERAAARLPELGFRSAASDPPEYRLPRRRLAEAVSTLLAEGWRVEGEGKLYRPPGRRELAVSSGVDWFELHGSVDFGGQTVELPALLAALRRGESFVRLGDGSFGLLPEEWLRRLAPVAGLGASEGDGEEESLRFRVSQATFLDALLAGEPEASCDETFARARERLRRFAGIAPAEAPAGFLGELRGYQKVGLGWLHFLRELGFGGCLADDMGLGKTVQVLALLEARRSERAGPSLVVVPRSLIFNWLAEAARFTPQLRVLDSTGTGRSRQGERFAGYDVVLTTYGTLRRDVVFLREVEFDYLILDEAQAIKNTASQTAKSARLLRGRHRLALTGTPIENHLGELWSLLDFLNPGLLGASALLRGHGGGLRDLDPEVSDLLARALRPFLLRRTKEQVAPELPAKLEQTLFCELPARQRRLYDELRDHYRASLGERIGAQGLGRSKILVLEALLRLRQAACHPGLLDPRRSDEPTAKLDLLLPQLGEILAEGHKALVFSQFTSFLALLRRKLDREGIPYLYLDGRTRDRQERVERFQSDPGTQLFLISLKAGGVGLNLTAADYVYLLDPWWNPAVEAQAIDRTHRIGQTRPVIACRLVARDTVEEKILELQQGKRRLADAIVRADGSLIAELSREDLELLLS